MWDSNTLFQRNCFNGCIHEIFLMHRKQTLKQNCSICKNCKKNYTKAMFDKLDDKLAGS